MIKKQFRIQGMHCVGCAMLVDEAIEDLPGVQSASTSYAKQIVDVFYDDTRVSDKALMEAVHEAGYTALPLVSKSA